MKVYDSVVIGAGQAGLAAGYHLQNKRLSFVVLERGSESAQIAVELSKDRHVSLSAGHGMKFLPYEAFNKSIFWWFEKLGILHVNVNSILGSWIRKQPDPIFGLELKGLIKKGIISQKPRTVTIQSDIVTFSDSSTVQVKNIVWATGYYNSYSWIAIPNTLDNVRKPIHRRGVSSCPGLYFLGLPWQYRRSSALIGGVGSDAEYIVSKMKP